MNEKETHLTLNATFLDMGPPGLIQLLNFGAAAAHNKSCLVMDLLLFLQPRGHLFRNIGPHLGLFFTIARLPHREIEFIPDFRSAKGMMANHERCPFCRLRLQILAHTDYVGVLHFPLRIIVARECEGFQLGKVMRGGLQLLRIGGILAVRRLNRDAGHVHRFPAGALQLGQRAPIVREIETGVGLRRRGGNLVGNISIRAKEARIET